MIHNIMLSPISAAINISYRMTIYSVMRHMPTLNQTCDVLHAIYYNYNCFEILLLLLLLLLQCYITILLLLYLL